MRSERVIVGGSIPPYRMGGSVIEPNKCILGNNPFNSHLSLIRVGDDLFFGGRRMAQSISEGFNSFPPWSLLLLCLFYPSD